MYGTTTTWADTTNATAGIESSIQAPMASVIVLLDPSNTDWWAYANRNIRCRNVPTGTGVSVGASRIDKRNVDGAATTIPNPNFDPNQPSTGTTTGANPLMVNACASLDPLNPNPIQRFAPRYPVLDESRPGPGIPDVLRRRDVPVRHQFQWCQQDGQLPEQHLACRWYATAKQQLLGQWCAARVLHL